MNNDTNGFDASRFLKSKWLKAGDVPKVGLSATVSQAHIHHFERDGVDKPILEFLELDQALPLNKTRVGAMAEAFGTDSSKWIGRRIRLTTANTPVGSTVVITSDESEDDAAAPAAEVVFE